MDIIEGKFALEGNQIFINGRKFVIRERKKDVERKPKYYLIALAPFTYISSLFPVGKDEQAYNFDFEKELWELMLKDGIAFIKKVEPFE